MWPGQQRLAEVEELSAEAFRTLGVAYRAADPPADWTGEVDASVERDLVYVGVVGIIDPPRAEAAAAIAEAHRAGIRVIMITGDHPTTASRIAADLGIIEPGGRAVTGAELDLLDDQALREVTREVSVYARVSPQHKLMLVDALQSDGQIVAMTGDGVNDAPALKSADIGVAMGITGTEVTKEASRMILGDDNFATIVAAVRQGRVIFDNIKKFLRYLLSSNMGEVLTVFLGVVFAGLIGLNEASNEAIVLPLLATQILWINLVTDSAPALAMGVDPEIDDVMARRPRKLTERAIDARMWRGIVSVGLVMALVALFSIDLFLPGWSGRGQRHARGRPHGRVHDPGPRSALQRAQRPLGDDQCLPRAVRQQVAVGLDPARCGAPGRRGGGAVPAGRLRHRVDGPRPLGCLRCSGLRRALVRRSPQDRAPGVRKATHLDVRLLGASFPSTQLNGTAGRAASRWWAGQFSR